MVFSTLQRYSPKYKKAVETILIPEDKSIEETWQSIQIITKWKEIIDKDEIERYLLQWSRLNHNQANASPALHPEHGLHRYSDNIPSEESYYKMWIEELLKQKTQMDKLEPEFEAFKHYIMKMKENKKTSPAGLHLRIYKALAQDDNKIRIAFDIMELEIRNNIILPRWRQTHQMLLQKEARPYIHRLRYITIIENDVQFLMKKWWAGDLQSNVDEL